MVTVCYIVVHTFSFFAVFSWVVFGLETDEPKRRREHLPGRAWKVLFRLQREAHSSRKKVMSTGTADAGASDLISPFLSFSISPFFFFSNKNTPSPCESFLLCGVLLLTIEVLLELSRLLEKIRRKKGEKESRKDKETFEERNNRKEGRKKGRKLPE